MFEQVMENYRKAAEATLQMQHELFQGWSRQVSQMAAGQPLGYPPGVPWHAELEAFGPRPPRASPRF